VIAGIIGLGRMGSAMAARLTENGFAVVGWDRDAAAVRAHADRGGQTAPDACGVAAAAEIVITSITEDHGVRSVFRGPAGVLAADVSGKLFVEMSTLQPATVRELAPEVEARGARLIDAPVLGTIPNVRAGTLDALAGGAAGDVARARVVLDVLARTVTHLGPLGSGHAMKLAVNLGLAAYVQGIAESLALGEREGLDRGQMLEVLKTAPTANGWLAARAGVLTGERSDVTLDIRTLRKDVMSAVATGARDGVTMPLAAGVLAALSAAVAGDWGQRDIGTLAAFLREAVVQRYEP
jgi:3-hydroxyisobutyrate dehydrogenase-like beta-hydroxyacid dehydrogenase